MKYITNYIIEKLRIGKDTLVVDIDMDDFVFHVLGPWLLEKDTQYKSFNSRYEFLKDFDNKIISLINHFHGSLEKLAKEANLTTQQLEHYVTVNNEELYKKCKNYYLDIYNEIQF